MEQPKISLAHSTFELFRIYICISEKTRVLKIGVSWLLAPLPRIIDCMAEDMNSPIAGYTGDWSIHGTIDRI